MASQGAVTESSSLLGGNAFVLKYVLTAVHLAKESFDERKAYSPFVCFAVMLNYIIGTGVFRFGCCVAEIFQFLFECVFSLSCSYQALYCQSAVCLLASWLWAFCPLFVWLWFARNNLRFVGKHTRFPLCAISELLC